MLTIFSNFPWENSIDSLTGVYFQTVLSASSERFCQRTKYYCDEQPSGVSSFLLTLKPSQEPIILACSDTLVHITFSLLTRTVSSRALFSIKKQSFIDPRQWSKTLTLHLNFAQHSTCGLDVYFLFHFPGGRQEILFLFYSS